MNPKDILDAHHVMRYCSPKHVRRNGQISETAFALKPDEQYLSVDWLEYFNGDATFSRQLTQVQEAVQQRLTVKHNGKFLKIQAGEVRALKLRIAHEPGVEADPSHAGIYPEALEDLAFMLALANLVNPEDIFPALSN